MNDNKEKLIELFRNKDINNIKLAWELGKSSGMTDDDLTMLILDRIAVDVINNANLISAGSNALSQRWLYTSWRVNDNFPFSSIIIAIHIVTHDTSDEVKLIIRDNDFNNKLELYLNESYNSNVILEVCKEIITKYINNA